MIVAAIGEKSKLGPVMGPDHAVDRPVAVPNPIFVDVDGGGFKHNGDTLGELPVEKQQLNTGKEAEEWSHFPGPAHFASRRT